MPVLIGVLAVIWEFGFSQSGFLLMIPAAWLAVQMMK